MPANLDTFLAFSALYCLLLTPFNPPLPFPLSTTTLQVGNVGLTYEEQVTHFALWCLITGPLLISTDLSTISNASLAILQHEELIAVNQDPGGVQGVRVSASDPHGVEVWAKPLLGDGQRQGPGQGQRQGQGEGQGKSRGGGQSGERAPASTQGGSVAAVFLNRGDVGSAARDIIADWATLGIAAGVKMDVRDMWSRKNVATGVTGTYTAKGVAAHSMVALKFVPSGGSGAIHPLPTPPIPDPIYCGPSANQTEAEWRGEMLEFRSKMPRAFNTSFCDASDDDLYGRNAEFLSSQFVCPLAMLSDRYLYNSSSHEWTVDRYLADLDERYGSIDCVLLWQSYTNMGVDEKNQIDLIRVAPGGVAGVRAVVAQFHARNVSVLFPWNYWASGELSYGPRAEPDANFIALLAAVGADGFNTDSGGRSQVPGEQGYTPNQTMTHGFDGNGFVSHGLQKFPMQFAGHDLLNQPEHGAGCPAGLSMGGWAGEGGGPGPGFSGKGDLAAACVECAKWLEPRHKTQWVGRHDVLRQPALKWAFFNGNGYATWESVFGSWNGISLKDGETIRRIFSVLRFFKRHVSSCGFRPFYEVSHAASVSAKATLFPLTDGSEWLLTLVSNTASPTSDVPLGNFSFAVPAALRNFSARQQQVWDVWNGVRLQPAAAWVVVGGAGGGSSLVSLSASSADEYGAVAMVSAATASSPQFGALMAKMRKLTATRLASLSSAQVPSLGFTFWTNEDAWEPYVAAAASVTVPAISNFTFRVQPLLWESGLFPRYPMGARNATQPPAGQVVTVNPKLALGAFHLDTYPVTNAEYAAFLAASNYTPADPINFVKHWGGARAPAAIAKQPVVYVGFEDAKRYCQFYKRRLPNEWEWSAAVGTDGRRWPWGNRSDTSGRCMPPTFNGPSTGSPAAYLPDVDAFDKHGCASQYGAQMIVGTVWQWTNALQDAHQRAGIIKGGSLYWRENVTKGRSVYFFPNCAKETWEGYGGRSATIYPAVCQGELYLQDGGSERSSTIGFRCAVGAGPPV